MRKLNRSWMAVVAAALLLGTLVGVVWARPNDSPQAAVTTRKVTLAPAEFIPHSDISTYSNLGYVVSCTGAEAAFFTVPVVFPTLNAVTVERIRLHVADASDTASATATLYRTIPSTGSYQDWGAAQSPPGLGNGLQTYNSPAINKVVWPSQRAYIKLEIASYSIYVSGVTVEYHVNS